MSDANDSRTNYRWAMTKAVVRLLILPPLRTSRQWSWSRQSPLPGEPISRHYPSEFREQFGDLICMSAAWLSFGLLFIHRRANTKIQKNL